MNKLLDLKENYDRISRVYSTKDLLLNKVKKFQVRKPIPISNDGFLHAKFMRFIHSLDDVQGPKGHKSNKISSAFRLYRIGNNSTNLESRLMISWSALETITRDAMSIDGSDDEKVAAATVPVIVMDYIFKRIRAFIRALLHLGINSITLSDQRVINFSDITNVEFFELLQEKNFMDTVILHLTGQPYFIYQFHRFADICQKPGELKKALDAHQEKIVRQIKRIYRARNLITHSGGKVKSLEFLCAHLEYYLKTCINVLIDFMADVPTIQSPEECFVRYQHCVHNILEELKLGTVYPPALLHLIKIHQ